MIIDLPTSSSSGMCTGLEPYQEELSKLHCLLNVPPCQNQSKTMLAQLKCKKMMIAASIRHVVV